MSEVFRGKMTAFGKKALPMYAFHGVTAVLALWLALKAVSQ